MTLRWMPLPKLKVLRYREMHSLIDFPNCQLLVTLLVRGRYYSVISRFCTFTDMIQQLCDQLGYTLEQAQRVVFLNAVFIGARDVDYLVANELVDLVAE